MLAELLNSADKQEPHALLHIFRYYMDHIILERKIVLMF